jgi:hypothetical protein
MKKLLFSAAAIIVSITVAGVAMSAQPDDVSEVSQTANVGNTKKIESSPVVEATVTPVPEPDNPQPTNTPQAPIKPPETPEQVNNETFISQYGWTQSPNRESIDYIITLFPDRFTDVYRQQSFEYLKRVADASGGIAYPYVYLRGVQGRNTPDMWERLGQRVGVQ